jgi:polyphosphate kinase 2 (PPK2 family)
MGALNHKTCYVKALRIPSIEEISHDYLWRIHNSAPSKGQIAIFNRSHYEDIIQARVHNLVPNKDLILRYRQINDFERYLTENCIIILKFFLYIRKEEQKRRLKDRLKDPTNSGRYQKVILLSTNAGISKCKHTKKLWNYTVQNGHLGLLSRQM